VELKNASGQDLATTYRLGNKQLVHNLVNNPRLILDLIKKTPGMYADLVLGRMDKLSHKFKQLGVNFEDIATQVQQARALAEREKTGQQVPIRKALPVGRPTGVGESFHFNNIICSLLEKYELDEKIVAPALKIGNKIMKGKRGQFHVDLLGRLNRRISTLRGVNEDRAYEIMTEMGKSGKLQQGFIDVRGRFTTREQAYDIMKYFKKIKKDPLIDRGPNNNKYFSEDIPLSLGESSERDKDVWVLLITIVKPAVIRYELLRKKDLSPEQREVLKNMKQYFGPHADNKKYKVYGNLTDHPWGPAGYTRAYVGNKSDLDQVVLEYEVYNTMKKIISLPPETNKSWGEFVNDVL